MRPVKIILASASPRRKQILIDMGLKFDIIPACIDEKQYQYLFPSEMVQKIAIAKALKIAEKVDNKSVIIAADTVAVFDGEILGKPATEEDAVQMLQRLSGKKHKVLSGICVMATENSDISAACEETEVFMKELSKNEIDNYIATGEPMDKAGAYGIQGQAGKFIDKINGSYTNVVGLPVEKLSIMLKKYSVII